MAEAIGTSRTNYERMKDVADRGVPELVGAMDRGAVKVSAAAEVAKLPKAEQRKAVKAGPAAVKEATRDQREARKREAAEEGMANGGAVNLADDLKRHLRQLRDLKLTVTKAYRRHESGGWPCGRPGAGASAGTRTA